MNKLIRDRLNHLKSELKALESPKLTKRGDYYTEKIKELKIRVDELMFLAGK